MELWERYSYRVFWSQEDQEYVGLCAELPGLSWLEKSPEAALRGVRKVAREGVEMLEEGGDPVPEPLYDRKYSGVFKVRIPPEVHRRLVLEASEQEVSLNRLVSAKLSAPSLRPGEELREVGKPYGSKQRRAASSTVASKRRPASASSHEPGGETSMRPNYDFSNARPNPYAKRLRRQRNNKQS